MFNKSWILPTKFSRPVFGINMYNTLANHTKHLKLVLYSSWHATNWTQTTQTQQPKQPRQRTTQTTQTTQTEIKQPHQYTDVYASVQAKQRNSILVHLSLFILVVLQARNHSRVVIWSGAGCAWHEDGVKFAMRVQRAANCIEGQTRLTLMCCACQVGTFGCAALVGLRISDLSSTLWAASCCTVVGNRNLVLLVVFNLMIDQPDKD